MFKSYFLDGTRITTGYIIEVEPLICDWSQKELEEYFSLKTKHEVFDHSNFDTNLNENDELLEQAKILESDSFVSVLLTSRMEHINYSTVEYDPVFRSCILSMPGEVEIRISQQGIFDVTVASKVQLNVSKIQFQIQVHDLNNLRKFATLTRGVRLVSDADFFLTLQVKRGFQTMKKKNSFLGNR